ncbi:MAG: cysteine protease StiP family protein [Nakamurella sp.]
MTTTRLPSPLLGPEFGSYRPDEVSWLLTDLSALDLEGDITAREADIQAGRAHYAESLPIEFQPDPEYQELFSQVLAATATRLAHAVGAVTELVLAERGPDIVLASLARAGTPIGILMRRWANDLYGFDLPHYAVSIVRGRGIDRVALDYLAAHHDPAKVVFVDGWTGKGAIAKELSAALAEVAAAGGPVFSDDLAVLADPGHSVRTFGTRDDFLIASACLNSTVSGLVSRTVLNAAYTGPADFHGAKFYRSLADSDMSTVLLDAVSERFPAVSDAVMAGRTELARSDRRVTFSGWAAVEEIRARYGIESVNFVKPGVGETTRVLLRRVPWKILVRQADHPDHQHLRLLAAKRGVPVDVVPDLAFSCMGLVRRLSPADTGEG